MSATKCSWRYKKGKDLVAAAREVMESLDGAFSVTGITGDGEFFAFKDPHGIKPLCAGHDPHSKTFAFSSETVSFDMNSFVRDFELNPGELVTRFTKTGLNGSKLSRNPVKPSALSSLLTLLAPTRFLTANTFTKSERTSDATSLKSSQKSSKTATS